MSSLIIRMSSPLLLAANSENLALASSVVGMTQYLTSMVKASFFSPDSQRKTFLSQARPLTQNQITYLLFLWRQPTSSISWIIEQIRSMVLRQSMSRSSLSLASPSELACTILGSDLLRCVNLERYFLCTVTRSSSICVKEICPMRNFFLSSLAYWSITVLVGTSSVFLTLLHLAVISLTYLFMQSILRSQAHSFSQVLNRLIRLTVFLAISLLNTSSLCRLTSFVRSLEDLTDNLALGSSTHVVSGLRSGCFLGCCRDAPLQESESPVPPPFLTNLGMLTMYFLCC